MKPGLVLSFCNKRWTDPVELAELCAGFEVEKVQFTWDIVDPMWESRTRDEIARGYSDAFNKAGIEITTCFSGLSAYAYPNLLAQNDLVRRMGLQMFERAIDMCSAMEIPEIGMAVGCMSNKEATHSQLRELRYYQLKEEIIHLCSYAKRGGIKRFSIEPTPVFSEIPNTAAQSLLIMEELSDSTDIPVLLMLDVGHVLCPSFNDEPRDMLYWLDKCGLYVSGVHLQQTDGLMDRHWGFDNAGIVRAEDIRAIDAHLTMHGKTQYLEYCPAFELPNSQVLKQVRDSLAWLRTNC